MKLGVLFSGGKDSVLGLCTALDYGHEVSCLINIVSENKDSYMFHTPSVNNAVIQAKAMNIPIIVKKTLGEKENELEDLEKAISEAKKKYSIKGVVTGAVMSVYQATRVQKICDNLNLEVFNPLWLKDELDLLEEIIDRKINAILVGLFAYPFTKDFLGRKIDKTFIKDFKLLRDKYGISPSGEGGEFETFVIDCELFKKKLKIKNYEDFMEGENSFRRELNIGLKNGR